MDLPRTRSGSASLLKLIQCFRRAENPFDVSVVRKSLLCEVGELLIINVNKRLEGFENETEKHTPFILTLS